MRLRLTLDHTVLDTARASSADDYIITKNDPDFDSLHAPPVNLPISQPIIILYSVQLKISTAVKRRSQDPCPRELHVDRDPFPDHRITRVLRRNVCCSNIISREASDRQEASACVPAAVAPNNTQAFWVTQRRRAVPSIPPRARGNPVRFLVKYSDHATVPPKAMPSNNTCQDIFNTCILWQHEAHSTEGIEIGFRITPGDIPSHWPVMLGCITLLYQ